MRSNLSNATLWRLGLAAAAGLWLGRRIPPTAALLATGMTLAFLPRRRPLPPVQVSLQHPSPWPEAPVAEPFVPHTRAWDDLREAISPIVHHPPLAEATNPFIPDESRAAE
ncbi:MAG TPA: hypothetical protein VD994_00085 [Prosthecobacter sp.]|nr:hypothetical protein [Prosthecobacter sp.]